MKQLRGGFCAMKETVGCTQRGQCSGGLCGARCGYLTLVRRPNLAARRACSSAATFSQSLRDRQYTIPHCDRPWWQNWRQMRSSISAMASSNLVFFFTTSYLCVQQCWHQTSTPIRQTLSPTRPETCSLLLAALDPQRVVELPDRGATVSTLVPLPAIITNEQHLACGWDGCRYMSFPFVGFGFTEDFVRCSSSAFEML